MTADEFKAALTAMGMNANGYAKVSGRNKNTVQNWTKSGDYATRIPQRVAEWLARRQADLERDPPP
jgi:roadblock/LC7 domain-containing protein